MIKCNTFNTSHTSHIQVAFWFI